MMNLKHTAARTLTGATITALAVTAGVMSSPAQASATEGPQLEPAHASESLIEGPLINLGNLLDLIGDINIGQFQ